MQNIAEQTGGKFFYAQTAEEIRRALFDTQQEALEGVDTTDTDGDGLYDTYEIAGMIIPNGRYIDSDPLDPDTDDDGLSDGEEMGELRAFSGAELAIAIISALPSAIFDYFTDGELNVHFKCFDYKSHPNFKDTDGDGIKDYYYFYEYSEGTTKFYYDNRPLTKGIYSSELGKIVIGEMTIVSSTYNNNFKGHSFLVYTSYVRDKLDFTGFYRGFELGTNNQLEPCLYSLGCDDKVAIGNSGDTEDYDDFTDIAWHGGMYFNREPKVEFTTDIEYNKNAYLTRQITQDQWDDFLDIWNEVGEYSLNSNNCSEAARKSWNHALQDNLTSKNGIKIISRPNELKESIMEQADYKTGYSIKNEFSKYYE